MNFIIKKIPLLLLIVIGAVSYAQPQVLRKESEANIAPNEILARVGEIEITAEEFLNSYEFGPAFVKRRPESKNKYLEFMINEKLLALKAYEDKLDTTNLFKNLTDAYFADMATEEMFKDVVLSRVRIQQNEIDDIVGDKNTELEIEWLFAEKPEKVEEYLIELKNGTPFDSLLHSQLSDSVFLDMRTMKLNRYQLRKKNPNLAAICDTLPAGKYSLPIRVNGGWYIVYLKNIWTNMVLNETESLRLREEARRALIKRKMDTLSDKFVDSLISRENPVIRSNAFRILQAYLGQYLLPKETYDKWELSAQLKASLQNLPGAGVSEIRDLSLISHDSGDVTIGRFLKWFWLRDQYIKLNPKNFTNFKKDLERNIWRMFRDELLMQEAHKRGYDTHETVLKQLKLWKDKIASASLLNNLRESIQIAIEEKKASANKKDIDPENQFIGKVYRILAAEKKRYSISIDHTKFNRLKVSSENNPKEVNLYTVKKGGLIPRTPYPVIDDLWRNWY